MGRHSLPEDPSEGSSESTLAGVHTFLPDASDRKHRPGVRRIVRGAVFTVITGALVAGSLAFTTLDKTVELVVDGKKTAVSTYAVTVKEIADEAGVKLAQRDSVTPGPSAVARDGATVTVVHARPLTVTVDGTSRTVWVAALTVDEAMDQLGLTNAWTTASRSSRITKGQQLVVSLPKTFTVTADGQTQQVTSAAPTVGLALQKSTVGLGALDRTSLARDTPVTPGIAVTIKRVTTTSTPETRAVPFATSDVPDAETYIGINAPATTGSDGQAVVIVEQTWVDGTMESTKDVSSTVTVAPVDAVQKVGAKPFPADVDALNWPALGKCESTNNPLSVNPTGTYTGEYQFSDATWSSVGGSGRANSASAAEQLARAKMLYIRSGAGQWECGSHLFD